MSYRILCPFHKESTPSCVVYPTGYKCFGCGASGTLAGINLEGVEKYEEKEPEDVKKTIKYIERLPCKEIRGVSLHYDLDAYYIIWPDGDYYKKRYWDSTDGKYISPRGIRRPLYIPRENTRNGYLFIVEGELNARSLASTTIKANICSPGSATDFYSKNSDKYLTYYIRHERIRIVADKDKAGAKAALELKKKLVKMTPYVDILLVEEDFNDILVKYGPEKLKEVALQGGL